MNRKILTILIALLVVGLVGAGIGIGALNKQRSLDKEQRDMLLSKTDVGEINPDVIITATDEYILWSAVQSGIISSENNKISRSYCSELNETTHECTTMSYYTNDEIQDIVADAVLDKLEQYADAEINRSVYENWGTGNVEIVEK